MFDSNNSSAIIEGFSFKLTAIKGSSVVAETTWLATGISSDPTTYCPVTQSKILFPRARSSQSVRVGYPDAPEPDIPVTRGTQRPLLRELTIAPMIHGVSGPDGADLPEPGFTGDSRYAVDFIIQTIMGSPLTNVAPALLKEPGLAQAVSRIVLMGEVIHDSNVSPAAEFNIFVDPEAAKIVFGCGAPIVMVGLDVANKSRLSFTDIDEMESWNGRVSRVVAPLLRFFANTNKEVFGFDGAPVHDALAVAYVVRPDVITTRRMNVEIETAGELTRGRTVADVCGISGRKPNVDVALEVNQPLFKEMIFNAIKKLDAAPADAAPAARIG